MTLSPLAHCPQCGAAIPEASEHGLCPSCVFAKAIQPSAEFEFTAPPPDLHTIREAFPHLEVIELIGRGGMGSVFKARQPQLDRFVALKILPAALADQPGFAGRFQREAKALAKLNHPHIVTVHDYGQAGGLYYLLMEFVDGVNLRQLIQSKRLTPREALSIVPPICDALQCAHDHGIVHRDIKPENLLIDKAGMVKIADFGIAKIVKNGHAEAEDGSEEPAGSGETMPLGTPDYAAPEQSEGIADHRADIYSLGVVLYEMLTGERPRKNFVLPSKRVQVDIRIDEIVLRALEKTPELRFQTAQDFRTRVEAITNHDTSLPSAQRNGGAPVSRFSRTAIAGACVAALGLLSLFLSVFVDEIVAGRAMPHDEGLPSHTASPATFALIGAALLYAFFATLLGWIAVSQIRRSEGRIYGLPLALFDGLLFPLLTLSVAIAVAVVALAKMFVDFYANPSAIGSSQISVVTRVANWLSLNNELAVIAGVMAATVVNVLIVRSVLMALRIGGTPAASGAKGKEAQAASIAIIFALIASALGALAAIRHGSAWPPMALSLLFAGLATLMALPGRRLAVGKCALIIATLGTVIWPLFAVMFSHWRGFPTVSAQAPTYQPAPETVPGPATPTVFGPVFERVITHPADGTENYFLDLDSGNFVAAPENVFNLLRHRFDELTKTGWTDEPIKNWARTSGADLSLAFTSPDVTPALYGGAIVFPTLPFEAADAREVLRMADDAAQEQKRDGKAMPPLTLFHRHGLDRDGSFVFRTREGGVGLMQMLSSTENPRSVKIRHKLILSGATSTGEVK